MQESPRSAHFDETLTGVVIEQVTVRDPDVTREAQRWTSGERGPVVDDAGELADADLSAFVTEAVRIGAHALSATGQAQDARVLERMLTDLGDKAAAATSEAAQFTGRAAAEAADAVSKAAGDAKKAIVEADDRTRKELTTAVAAAKEEMNGEIRRLVGGDNPELLDKLGPVLDRFGTSIDTRITATTADLLARVAKQFDPSDPTSPMAKHAADLGARQEKLTAQIDKHHADLTGRVDELTTALKVREARMQLTKVTPIKGDSYANQLHLLLADVAAGLGDEYSDTSASVGAVTRCKKGDGVLSLGDGTARVVIEMTDSAREGWAEYLDEAERNRRATVALGLVRTPEQNGGQSIRVLGGARIVLAFDPECDDPVLLRTVVMLVRTVALASAQREGAQQIATAEEKIAEALRQLDKIDEVKKSAGSIQRSATKIESSCTSIYAGIHRLLDHAAAALTEAADGEAAGRIESAPGAA